MAQRMFTGDDVVTPGDNPEANMVMSRLSSEPMVTIYFVNYMIVEKDPESASYGKITQPIQSHVDQRLYNIPPIGESMQVRQRVAEDLQTRLRIYDPVHGEFPGFVQDANMAKVIRSAFERGELAVGDKQQNAETALTFQSILEHSYRQSALESMSIEDLEEALAQRKAEAKPPTKKSTK